MDRGQEPDILAYFFHIRGCSLSWTLTRSAIDPGADRLLNRLLIHPKHKHTVIKIEVYLETLQQSISQVRLAAIYVIDEDRESGPRASFLLLGQKLIDGFTK